MQYKLSVFLALSFFVSSHANPHIEREFNRILDSNQCLKQCMAPVQQSDLELLVFKRANYSDYFLKIDQICNLIADARSCIDKCETADSNPFALISVNAICSEKARRDAALLKPCFINVGAQVHDQCVKICGDFEALNNQNRIATSTLEPNDAEATQIINSRNNQACLILKCSVRCSIDHFNRQCDRLANGKLAGDTIREIVEGILENHRQDLQVFGLIETMQKNTQLECNYLHTPDALFHPLKDIVSQQMLRNSKKPWENSAVALPLQQTQSDTEQSIKMTADQLKIYVLKKQLQVLDKQLKLMDQQEHQISASNQLPYLMQAQPRFNTNDMF